MTEIRNFIKTIYAKKKYQYDFDHKNKHKLLNKNDTIPFDVIADHLNIHDSPYVFDLKKNTNYKLPTKQHREIVCEEILKQEIIPCPIDFLFFDVQFHAKKLIIQSIDEFFIKSFSETISHEILHQIFNGTLFGLTWIYPISMKIVFDSLYHLNALLREMALYWSYPNASNKKTETSTKYTDFIIDQKSAELCSQKFNAFLQQFHRFFHIEYMYRHYQRWERYPLKYDIIYAYLLSFLIRHVFDSDETLFHKFMEDDMNHVIPIYYSAIDDMTLLMREAYYCKSKNTFQYQTINKDGLCHDKQNDYIELMVQFKQFIRQYCIPNRNKLRNQSCSRLHFYDLCKDDSIIIQHNHDNISILYGQSEAWLDKYKIIFPVSVDFMYHAHSSKIVNHGPKSIIF